jgi:hypothetical protein
MNPQVGPDPSTAPGGQLVPAGKGHGCLFAQSGNPEGPVPRPRRARQAVQILVLFEPVPRLGRFGFRISPLSSSGNAFVWRARAHRSLGVRGGGLVQATVRLLLGRRRAQEGNNLLHKR